MSTADKFFLIFLATVIVARIFLYYKPLPSPTVRGFRTHHYMIGIILAVMGFLFSDIVVYGIGFGLFVDELPYLIIRGKNHQDNYSLNSLADLLVCIILVYIFRDHLVF